MAFDFNTLVTEAERRNKKRGANATKPFELKMPGGHTIKIDAPDATTYLALSDVDQNNVLQQFRILFGSSLKDYNTFIEALEGKPMQILYIILEEAFDFWGAEVPSGKSEN